MKLEAEKEMDRKYVLDWLNEIYSDPSLSYCKHTDEKIRIFAHDALVLLKEQEERIKLLEHQLETLTKWRMNAGAFD